MSFEQILDRIDGVVWGLPTIFLILGTGLILTFRLRGLQFRKLGLALKSIFRKPDGEHGEVSSFGALCTALSATIGTGNIVGVATAIAAGGPGALFWMWIAALLGIATKYAECMLAVKYRERKDDGHILGGPFYTIEKGMKERTGFNFKWLGKLFAIFAVMAGLLGIGTMTQINGITTAVNNAVDKDNTHVVYAYGIPTEAFLEHHTDNEKYAALFVEMKNAKDNYYKEADLKIRNLQAEGDELFNNIDGRELEVGSEEYLLNEQNVARFTEVSNEIDSLVASKGFESSYFTKKIFVTGSEYEKTMFCKDTDFIVTWAIAIAGLFVTIFAALVIIGGLKRISKVATVVVPFMAVIYVFLGLSIILMNATIIPEAFSVIFRNAFGFPALAGGAAGFIFKTMTDSMQKGVARGIFSNEAGLGSAAIAASTAQVEEPVAQGLVSMTGTFIDTIIVCTMTGLAIVIAFFTGENASGTGDLQGVAITSAAFSKVLGGDGHSVQFLLMICLVFFAFTTILGWSYYSEKCLEYLTNGKMGVVKVYRILYILAVAAGPYLSISAVWTIADITNGLMAIPNCIALVVLSGVAARSTKEYFDKYPTLK